MNIGVGLDARLGLPWDELREMARAAARLGFESVWTPAGGVPDAFHVCAAWSEDTSLRTGIAVVPAARMWTPLSLAAQAATVAMRSSGRFVLGLGTGGSGPAFWQALGLPNLPIAHMRDYTRAVQQLLAGETVTSEAPIVRLRQASLGLSGPLSAPVFLAALGAQMLGLAGEVADGALLNWATPERIALSRSAIAAGARRAGREASAVPLTMYVRVWVDDDVHAARRALGEQVIGYALAQPGVPYDAGYRGLFAQMGFDAVVRDLEARRDAGASMHELVAATPDELLQAVGYYGRADGAPRAFARLSVGLDEAIVRIITARPGAEPVVHAMESLTPSAIRAAASAAGGR
jgi:alkanesulfonate monooxygenase SsuD/methylene tetrahydromethanopterin reductase-like flavin-dependent oxidoreductase (luciferase family)